MYNRIRSSYVRLYLLSFAVTIITAWFSEGYYNPDEHFQILEYAGYRLGQSPAADLPWEFGAKIRPALQPAIACAVISASKSAGVADPFIHAFILRLLTGIFGWYVICRASRFFAEDFGSEKSRFLFVATSLLLWFVPFLNVRFSSETLGGITFLFALTLLLEYLAKQGEKGLFPVTWPGLLLGFSFFARFHLGFAIMGLLIWLILVRKVSFRIMIVLFASSAVALGICIAIDYWFYGEFVLTPVRFYAENVIRERAASWGVMPWYSYFPQVFARIVPPLSLVLLPAFLAGIFRKPLSVFTIIAVPFLAAHFIAVHKETRFLIPMVFPFIYLAWTGLEAIAEKVKDRRILRYTFRFLAVVNLVLLAYVMFAPAQEAIRYYRFLYNYPGNAKVLLLSEKKPAFKLVGQHVNFYKSERIQTVTLGSMRDAGSYLDSAHTASALVLSRKISMPPGFANYNIVKEYSLFPGWFRYINFNHWQERSNTWCIYKADRKN